jgi:hypothetical protein
MSNSITDGAAASTDFRPRAAFLVPNPCRPDHRVIKQAEYLESKGYQVRIYCQKIPGVPEFEKVNGVEYVRIRINRYALFKGIVREHLLALNPFKRKSSRDLLIKTRKDNLSTLENLVGRQQ